MTVTFKLNKPDATVHLKARKTMSGDIMIYDHPDFDVVVSPSSQKIFALAKEQYGSHVYASQSRLFDYLSKHGVVRGETVHAGNVFGSLEGLIVEVEEKQKEDIDSTQVAIYSIAKFFEGEKGHYSEIDKFEDDLEKHYLDPSEEDSTELGDVPQHPKKGSHGFPRGPYGFMYNYSLVRENQKEE